MGIKIRRRSWDGDQSRSHHGSGMHKLSGFSSRFIWVEGLNRKRRKKLRWRGKPRGMEKIRKIKENMEIMKLLCGTHFCAKPLVAWPLGCQRTLGDYKQNFEEFACRA